MLPLRSLDVVQRYRRIYTHGLMPMGAHLLVAYAVRRFRLLRRRVEATLSAALDGRWLSIAIPPEHPGRRCTPMTAMRRWKAALEFVFKTIAKLSPWLKLTKQKVRKNTTF